MQTGTARTVVVGVEDQANIVFDGRCVRSWTQEQISFLSDLIVSATLIETERLGRLEGFEQWEEVGVRAVEMTFSISQIFKGAVPPDGKLVVRYYEAPQADRLETSIEADAADTQKYLLYLLEEANNRFTPTAGPMESLRCIRPQQREGRAEKAGTHVLEAARAVPCTPAQPGSSQPGGVK